MDRLRIRSYVPLQLDHRHEDEWIGFEPVPIIHEGSHEDREVLRCPRCEDYEISIDYPAAGQA